MTFNFSERVKCVKLARQPTRLYSLGALSQQPVVLPSLVAYISDEDGDDEDNDAGCVSSTGMSLSFSDRLPMSLLNELKLWRVKLSALARSFFALHGTRFG